MINDGVSFSERKYCTHCGKQLFLRIDDSHYNSITGIPQKEIKTKYCPTIKDLKYMTVEDGWHDCYTESADK